jgi:Zn-dependent alcohol dehydrogenase
MKTRAAIQLEHNGPLTVDEIELPNPDENQIVVKQFASGICHSQLHQMHNPNLVRPLLLGHESTGVVVGKGRNVTHVKEGDHVMVTWVPRTGKEGMTPPTQGSMSYQGKTASWQAAPTWAESTVAHEQYVVPLAKDVATDVTAIIGCAVMTGVGAVLNTAKVEKGSRVAIYGLGGVGLCVLTGCVIAGASQIIAVDLHDDKLALAREFHHGRDQGGDEAHPEGHPDRQVHVAVDARVPLGPAALQGHAPPQRRASDRGGRRQAARHDALDQGAGAGGQGQELAIACHELMRSGHRPVLWLGA